MADGEDTYNALFSRVETFWEVCADAIIGALGSEANFTCQEVEALIFMLEGIIRPDEIEDIIRAHAAWPDTASAGDCECDDMHHQVWVNEHGTCDGCNLEPAVL